jgi:hypothetical protein
MIRVVVRSVMTLDRSGEPKVNRGGVRPASQCSDTGGIGFFERSDSSDSPGHRVAMKTMANSEAIAVRLQKVCMAQKQCCQNTSIHALTIHALRTVT